MILEERANIQDSFQCVTPQGDWCSCGSRKISLLHATSFFPLDLLWSSKPIGFYSISFIVIILVLWYSTQSPHLFRNVLLISSNGANEYSG